MDYPENIIKGIPNNDCLIEGRIVGSNLFHFDQPRDECSEADHETNRRRSSHSNIRH